MDKNIEKLYPNSLWSHFKEISQIPRPSKKEGQIVEYLMNKAESLGLEYYIDPVGNCIIRKPATAGFENRKGVVLQGHVDMVPQKNSDKVFNFDTDSIEAYIDGAHVTANGTTLGADNGIAVATMLAILKDTSLTHGPIECLFTVDEETGMTGAFELEKDVLEGDILLNLDTEEEGELCVGCAGGMDTTCVAQYTSEPVPENHVAFTLSVTGLKGGHSGMDINLGRGNSIKILNRILWYYSDLYALRLADIEGGSLRNAIPREAFATFVVPEEKKQEVYVGIAALTGVIKGELELTEPDLRIAISPTDLPKKVIDKETQVKLLNAIYAIPNGAVRMTDGMPEVVETSSNLAAIEMTDEDIRILSLLRSSVDSAKRDLGNIFTALCKLTGMEVIHNGNYPGWKPNFKASILDVMKLTYKEMYGKEAIVKVIHAGLECGIIGSHYPAMELISFGPDIMHPHSPDEYVAIASVGRYWDYLLKVLENIPVKNS